MPERSYLTGPNVILRAPKPRDVVERLALGQNPEIVRMFGGDPAQIQPMTEARAKGWVDRLGGHPHAWVVERDGRLLGEVRLDALDRHDRRARLAIGLYDPSALGIGLGRQAIKLVLRYGFESLQLHRIGLQVIAFNTRAIRCYRACGFKEEGREREAAYVAGEWHDDIMMGILSREFGM